MRSTFLFFIVVMLTFALAAPLTSSKALTKRSFRVATKGHPKRSPREAMAHAYAKYGWKIKFEDSHDAVSGSSVGSVPSSAAPPTTAPSSSTPAGGSPTTNSTGSGVNGEVQATPEQSDSAYVAPVKIGDQMFNLDFDTGSSDLWVFSSSAPAAESAGHELFNPGSSSTFSTLQGGSFKIKYGDGSTASGTVGFDTVEIGGATVQKQCVELADQTQGFESFVQSDGLLGLAFSSINQVKPQPQKTFFDNIMSSLSQPVFTADLEENASGSYDFGNIDTSKFTGSIHYAPVDNSLGFWMVQSASFAVGGSQMQCQGCVAVVDTGTSLMLVDNQVAESYYSKVQGAEFDATQGGFVYPCDATLPDFSVAIGNYTATVKGSDITFAQTSKGCFGGIQASGSSGPGSMQIFGDALLRNFFVVFDGGNTQVGFATKP